MSGDETIVAEGETEAEIASIKCALYMASEYTFLLLSLYFAQLRMKETTSVGHSF